VCRGEEGRDEGERGEREREEERERERVRVGVIEGKNQNNVRRKWHTG
jgi:hypothetical protein